MRKGAHILAALLIGLSIQSAAPGIARQEAQQDSRRREQEKQKELRLKAREYFEGRDEWTAPPASHEEHFERLVKLTDAVVKIVQDYRGLDLSVPAFALKNKPGAARDSYDYVALFGQECPPSGQPNNYYANLTRTPDPEDPARRSYQERLRNLIMTDPRARLEPADVMKFALDAAHGNYRLAMLTAHNFFKEIAYVGREEIKDIGEISKPADKSRWPAEWVGVSPWLGDIVRKLHGLRDSRVADKIGPWYHLFVPLAGEAWGSEKTAEDMTAWEHFFRKWKVFSYPDPEKREIDLVAISMMKDIRRVREQAAAGAENSPAATPGQPAGPSGELLVTLKDPLSPDYLLNLLTLRATTGVEPNRSIVTFMAGRKIALSPGEYLIELEDVPDFTARPQSVRVKEGQTANLEIVLQPDFGYFDITVTDGKTGQSLAGVDVAISGPISSGPEVSPASFWAKPGGYRIIVPRSVVNGVTYPGKEVTAEAVAGRRVPVVVPLDRTPQAPAAALIRIAPGALELNPGDREGLAVEVEDGSGVKMPWATVTWSSSAPAIAGVDATGEVSGVSAGKATITAASGGAKASIVVQVISTIQLQSCRITEKPKSLPARGGSYLLKGEAYDTDGKRIDKGIRLTWESLNTGVATVDKETGRITTKAPGKFTAALTATADDETGVRAMEEIVVENSWADVLVYGRVLKPDGSAAVGAMVEAGGGPLVMSDGAGDYTVLAGGGPYPEGGPVEVHASLDGSSGQASGNIRDGFAKDVTIVLAQAAPALSTAATTAGNKPKALTAEERQARLDQINDWQKALDCLLEGKRKYPNYWQDCNGNWTMRSRDVEIASLQELIRDAKVKLGLPVTVANDEPASGTGTPGLRATSASSAGADPTLLNFLTFLDIYGPSNWYTPPGGAETRLEKGASPPPGSAVRTDKKSHVTVLINKQTTATIAPESRVVLPQAEAAGGRKALAIQSGRVDFSRREGPPTFEDIMVTSRHGSLAPQGTIFRVEVDETETRLTVFEGVVHASGKCIYRDYGPGVESGKPSPSTELDVKTGERARLLGFGTGAGAPGQVPQWITGKDPARENGQAGAGGEKPAGQAGSALPSWAKPAAAGGGERQPSDRPRAGVVGPLDVPDPWNQPEVQRLMDAWVSAAVPPSHTPGVVMRYNEWAQPLSQAARATANPDHPADWTRYRYLWENRWRYDSTNLCKLGIFIEKNIKGESIADCRTAGGAAAPGAAPASGRNPEPAVGAAQPAEPSSRSAITASELFGLLAAHRAFEGLDWINGQPDMQGREVILFLLPDCPGRDNIPQQAYMCLQQAQNSAARISASGSVFVLIAGGQCPDGRDAVDAWKTILQGFRFTFPSAIDRNGEALRALLKLAGDVPATGQGYVGLVIGRDGKILRSGTCHVLFQGLIENKKG